MKMCMYVLNIETLFTFGTNVPVGEGNVAYVDPGYFDLFYSVSSEVSVGTRVSPYIGLRHSRLVN